MFILLSDNHLIVIEVCKGTNLSVFLQRIKEKEEMDNKKPITLNNLEEWDFTDLSLIRTDSWGTKYHHINEPAMKVGSSESYIDSLKVNMDSLEI